MIATTSMKFGISANFFIVSGLIGHFVTQVTNLARGDTRSIKCQRYGSIFGQNGSVMAVKPTKSPCKISQGNEKNRCWSGTDSVIHGATFIKVVALLMPTNGFLFQTSRLVSCSVTKQYLQATGQAGSPTTNRWGCVGRTVRRFMFFTFSRIGWAKHDYSHTTFSHCLRTGVVTASVTQGKRSGSTL